MTQVKEVPGGGIQMMEFSPMLAGIALFTERVSCEELMSYGAFFPSALPDGERIMEVYVRKVIQKRWGIGFKYRTLYTDPDGMDFRHRLDALFRRHFGPRYLELDCDLILEIH